jgi:hypothetical protein
MPLLRHRSVRQAPPNPRILVFKCVMGLGNRLNNLINMFVLHEQYPHATIYLYWPVNNHCGASVADLFDLSGYNWIHHTTTPPRTPGEFWATTTSTTTSPWDTLTHWTSRSAIVSHAVWPYRFVSHPEMARILLSLPLQSTVTAKLQEKRTRFGDGRPIIHYRKGDLLNILRATDAAPVELERRIAARLSTIPADWRVETYTQAVPDRPCDAVIDALADLLYFSRHCDLRGYCPYSTFSSWLFVLSPRYRPNLPCFTTGVVDLILLTS